MSLLMDALRKAEQQKQLLAEQKQQAPQDAQPAGLALELVPHPHEEPQSPASPPPPVSPAAPRPTGDRLPELPKRLEDLDEQFMAHAAAPQPARRATPTPPPPIRAVEPPHDVAADTARANARLLFEAKQPAPENRRSFLIIVGVLTLLAAGGIGGYVWWELQPKGGLLVNGAPSMPPMPRTPASPTATPIAPSAPMAAAAPATPAEPQAAVPPAPTFATSPSTQADPVAAQDTLPPSVARKPVADQQRAQAITEPESPIRLTRKRQAVDPALEQAWQAFNRQEFTLAQAAWQRALTVDPRNADALHGLAALALQEGQGGEAAGYYLRALEANPKDALALAGLVSLKSSGEPRQTESRLKNLLAEQPDSPYLNFALGNLYVQEQRWAEAQQAFFKAHAADPANPDYLFNLAVSLDQLHKPGLAAQYYNQALTTAEQRTAGFDAAQVKERLKALQSARQD